MAVKKLNKNTYKYVKIKQQQLKSSSRSNAAAWLPASVLHALFGLPSQDSVTLVNVFGLIVDC